MDSAIAVYLHGKGSKGCFTWYRIVLETSSSSPAPPGETFFPDTVGDEYDDIIGDLYVGGDYHPITLHHPPIGISLPVAVLPSDNADFGYDGGWAVIGDEIYWAGGWLCDMFRNFTVSSNLLKHNICLHQDKLDEWEKVCTLTIPHRSPFITAVGRKIAIVGGFRSGSDDEDRCGEIYDLDKQTLDCLNSEINILKHYERRATSVVEDDAQIVFYSTSDGSMLFLDASTGDVSKKCDPDPLFAVRSPQATAPPPRICAAVGGSNPVFLNRTFYFFSSELVLYGYDVDRHKWFQSKCLLRKLHLLPIRHLRARRLVGLPNGNLLVILSQLPPLFTMASLSVCKSDDDDDNVSTCTTLGVTVEHIQYFRAHDRFTLSDAKAISLKNTGSSTT